MIKRPDSLDLVVCAVLVDGSINLMSTPGMVAPCWSVTFPATVPDAEDCDQAGGAPRLKKTPRHSTSPKNVRERSRELGVQLHFICIPPKRRYKKQLAGILVGTTPDVKRTHRHWRRSRFRMVYSPDEDSLVFCFSDSLASPPRSTRRHATADGGPRRHPAR